MTVMGSAIRLGHLWKPAEMMPKVSMPIMRFQPALPSARDTVSMTRICVIGSASAPWNSRGPPHAIEAIAGRTPRRPGPAGGVRVPPRRRARRSTARALRPARRKLRCSTETLRGGSVTPIPVAGRDAVRAWFGAIDWTRGAGRRFTTGWDRMGRLAGGRGEVRGAGRERPRRAADQAVVRDRCDRRIRDELDLQCPDLLLLPADPGALGDAGRARRHGGHLLRRDHRSADGFDLGPLSVPLRPAASVHVRGPDSARGHHLPDLPPARGVPRLPGKSLRLVHGLHRPHADVHHAVRRPAPGDGGRNSRTTTSSAPG